MDYQTDKNKQVILGQDARDLIIKGIDILADAVVTTLGPNGRNAVYIKDYKALSTKDGVTVANSINLSDPVLQAGVKLIREASVKTADVAGDGTTTSTLLARSIVKNAQGALASGENAVQIKREVDECVQKVVEILKEQLSEDISSEEQVKQIATISANNDEETGKLIATAIDKVGMEGIVHIEKSNTGETYLETVEGLKFGNGYKSPYFVTDNDSMTSNLENPFILIVEDTLSKVKELLPILEHVSNQAKSLLIIANEIDSEALAALIVNKMRGTLNVCAVKAPFGGDRRKLLLEDIATLTGGMVFSKEKGMKFDKFSYDWFGNARSVKITKDSTTIIDGKGDQKNINERISNLKSQIDKSDKPHTIELLQERVASLVGGVSIIHVGGLTEAESQEKIDRVEDALHATRASIENGILPGGGKALLKASSLIEPINTGYSLVINACKKPFEQILINAGKSRIDAKIIEIETLKSDNWDSYDIKNEKIANFKDLGIIDPTKVTISALKNAASVAGTILLTETVIVDEINAEE